MKTCCIVRVAIVAAEVTRRRASVFLGLPPRHARLARAPSRRVGGYAHRGILKPLIVALLTAALSALTARAANPGDEVVVVYNNRMPESKSVADYYALKRHVPTNQIFGFDLPPSEDMTRTQYRDALQKPLAKMLEQEKLWHIGSVVVPETTNSAARVDWRPIESKIRYAVLCYGVPARIVEDPALVEVGQDKMRPEMRRNEAAVDCELALLPMIEQKYMVTGPLRNPFYTVTNAAAFHPTNGILLVARLDGPSADISRGLVDKAMQAEAKGLWGRAYFDLRGVTDAGYKLGDEWIRAAAEITRLAGFEVVVDTNAATFPLAFPMSQIAFYAGWYDGQVSGPFTRPSVEFMPGAFAYHLHSYSANHVRSASENWVGPLLAKGATCTMGCVVEPYLQGTPDMGVFFGRFVIYGFAFGEAAYACQNSLSWMTTVIGDPLYRPFGKNPQLQHQDLERRHSPMIEWSHLRVVDLNQARKFPLAESAAYLEALPLTKTSAVLTEKLADVYAALGKPASTVRSYQEALKLDPTPQQRVRLRLTLGDKLLEQSRDDEAYENYQKLLAETPDYPDAPAILTKLLDLARKLGKADDAVRYEAQLHPAAQHPAAQPQPAATIPAATNSGPVFQDPPR